MRLLVWDGASVRLGIRYGVLSLVILTLSVVASACSASTQEIGQNTEQGGEQSSQPAEVITGNAAALTSMMDASAVYLSETHTEVADHAAQLEIIQALDQQNEIAIALEMFQRPFQPVLDAYIAGEITEAELVAQSEYETRWGFDWELYAPIVRYAKENQIPLIALNTPAEITRQVATKGLESLGGEDLQFIPPVDEIDLSNEAYRDSLMSVFSAHGGHGNSDGFENFFAAQVLWDETMAEGVAKQLAAEPERQVVVLAGEGHVGYGYGIPDRVRRRLPEVKQISVEFVGAEESVKPGFTDLSWRL